MSSLYDSMWDDDDFDENSLGDRETIYAGLSNQGATCYMNSLLQALYMSPEFRTAVYKWEYNKATNGPTEGCVPYQLQQLFGELQMTRRAYIETHALTKSFGWTDSDSFTQHDVQELLRVLLEALETAFAGTPQASIVKDLYQGTLVDYIRCQECGHSRERTDTYLDIPLVIRNMHSIQQSLRSFTRPELLNESNQYFCEKCNKKVDALKGLKFQDDFPLYLTLQLMRFDFDYDRLERVKLNDEVSFPLYLNMDEFLNPPTNIEEANKRDAEEKAENELQEDIRLAQKLAAEEDDNDGFTSASASQGQNAGGGHVDPFANVVAPAGKNVYELFAILIHSGSAAGGHYYAYLRDFQDGKWYEFNDFRVSPLSSGDIERTFGGVSGPSLWGGVALSRSANAYMLLYRHTTSTVKNVPVELVPTSISERMNAENAKFEEKAAELRRKKDLITIKVVYLNEEYMVSVSKKDSLLSLRIAAMQTIRESFPPADRDSLLPMDTNRTRLRAYNLFARVAGMPYNEHDDMSLQVLGFTAYKVLSLELREEGAEWEVFDPDAMVLRIAAIDPATGNYLPDFDVAINKEATLGDLKALLEPKLNFSKTLMRVFELTSMPDLLAVDMHSLRKTYRIGDGDRLHVEYYDGVGPSVILQKFEETRNVVTLRLNQPLPVGEVLKDDPLYTVPVTTDRRKNLGELRVLIGAALNLPVDGFKLRRGPHAAEFKDSSSTLASLCLMDGANLYVELGRPCRVDEWKMTFILFMPSHPDSFLPLMSATVNEKITTRELKELIADRVGIDPDHMRLRERYSNKPTKIYRDRQTLKQVLNYIFDGKEVVVERIAKPERLADDDLLLCMRRWQPELQALSEPDDIVVKNTMSQVAFHTFICERYGTSLKHTSFAKPWSPTLDILDSMGRLQWEVTSAADHRPLHQGKWVLKDGDVILYKDTRGVAGAVSKSAGGGGGGGSSLPPYPHVAPKRQAEAALKINIYKAPGEGGGVEGATGGSEGGGVDDHHPMEEVV